MMNKSSADLCKPRVTLNLFQGLLQQMLKQVQHDMVRFPKVSLTDLKINQGVLVWILALLIWGLSGTVLKAQPVITAETMSLGGGGTAYLNGPGATFWNPANLIIRDRPGHFHLDVGQGALQFEPVLWSRSVGRQLSNFGDGYRPYEQGSADINAEQRSTILGTHFPTNKLRAHNYQRVDMMLGGALWQRNNYAFSIALRARYGSHIEVGRGWYDNRYVKDDKQRIRDFSLIQQRSELYELAVGYAQEFTFINGLMPRLSTLYIGIAPKIILAGPTFDASYQAQQIRGEDNSIRTTLVSDFAMESSGSYSRTTSDYLQSRDPQEAIRNNLSQKYQFQQTGFGLGFDFGLSYVIPLSGNQQTDTNQSSPSYVHKSLRIGLSLNDIGAIRYNKEPLNLSSESDTSLANYQPTSRSMFTGAGGQYLSYLHQATLLPNPILNAEQQSDDSYSTLLPTSINAGLLLDLARVKFMGDLRLGLNNTAFTSKNMGITIGTELRPVKQIPIRIGTHFAAEQPFQLGFGTGFESKHWNFTIGAQTLFYHQKPKAAVAGGAFGGLQFHF